MKNSIAEFDDVGKKFEGLALGHVGEADYKRLRILEPQLVSILDKKLEDVQEIDFLGVSYKGELCGVTSLVTAKNQIKPLPRNEYARIDLVITVPEFRGCGVGRILCDAALVFLVTRGAESIYSISCLAAHDAVAKILRSRDFIEKGKKERGYQALQLELNDDSGAAAFARGRKYLLESAQRLNYCLRQTESERSKKK